MALVFADLVQENDNSLAVALWLHEGILYKSAVCFVQLTIKFLTEGLV